MDFTPEEITEIRMAVESTIFEMIREQSEMLDERDIKAMSGRIKKKQALHAKIMEWYHQELTGNAYVASNANQKLIDDLDEALDLIDKSDATPYYMREMRTIGEKAKTFIKSSNAEDVKKGYEVAKSIISSTRKLNEKREL